MSKQKKQHYVPQVYLKQFTIREKNSDGIYMLLKKEKKLVKSNIRDVAVERDYYTVEQNRDDKYAWENKYAQDVEPLMSEVIGEILSKCNNVLLQSNTHVISKELKEKLAKTMMYQIMRGPITRRYIKKLYGDALSYITNKIHEDLGPLSNDAIAVLEKFENEEDYFRSVAMHSTLYTEISGVLTNLLTLRNYIFYRIDGNEEFITSDSPIQIVDSTKISAPPFGIGLSRASSIIYFTITPKLLIGAYHPLLYRGAVVDYDGKIVILDSNLERSFIESRNQWHFDNCHNQVYASRKELLKIYT